MTVAPQISVIIPVYNAGHYLQSCLDSVCNQTTDNIEILCIDDCSKDDSLDILRKYERSDPRIKVFLHKFNKGCAAARNIGMANARARYIYFIDSDDWIDTNYLEELQEIADNFDLPLVYNSRILLENVDGTSELFDPGNYAANIGFNSTGFINSHANIGNFAYSNCCCLYRRDYLENLHITFPEGLDYTDNYFHIATFIPQTEIYVTNKNSYHYRIHNNSISAMNRKFMRSNDILRVYELILNFYIEHGYIERCKLNFFELKKYIDRLKYTPFGYQQLQCLIKKSLALISKNISLYRDEELFFFTAVSDSPNYNAYILRINNFFEPRHKSIESIRIKNFNYLRRHIRQHINVLRNPKSTTQ